MESNTISKRFYRINEIIGDSSRGIPPIIPVSRASWYLGVTQGRYPKPVRLSERTSAWRAEDISALCDRLASGKWNAENAEGENNEK